MYNSFITKRLFLKHIIFIIFIFILGGCSYSPAEPIKVEEPSLQINYLTDIKPILDKRCVTCHSCYNSPCQAKFSSFDGVDRGGSKDKVYLAERLFAQKPTRLFIDAKNTKQWRKKKFFSLTNDTSEEGFNNSIMGYMLHDKQEHPEIVGEYVPEMDDLLCPQTLEEVSQYLDEKENHGMPYGFPALSKKEHRLMMAWLYQGAVGPSAKEEAKLKTPSTKAQVQINLWEKFLNEQDAKHKMTSRYLYEHYFLAHINFEDKGKEFYRLIRSRTPSGEEIDELPTLRPYDDPEMETFYYRFLKIHSTLVHKTHIVVVFEKDELARVKELFIKPKWIEEPHAMGYEGKLSANPFLTYAQIPPKTRYQFLLDHNEYFVRTFIRGPVCKGQIALNVIHDHFWLLFQDPKYDVGVLDPDFLVQQAHNLSMPIEEGSGVRVYKAFSDKYKEQYKSYYAKKLQKQNALFPEGWPLDGIWKGRVSKDAPALTIYRHFDSASIDKGLIGELPRTLWVIDYAHFERIYYNLVAGFDVYGNVSHQLNIRRYMDFLRLEGELNFLGYMPTASRKEIFESWYIGDDITEESNKEIKQSIHHFKSSILYKTSSYKHELIETLVNTHFLAQTNIHFDKANYFALGETIPHLPKQYKHKKDFNQAIRALNKAGSGFIRHVTDDEINLAYIRINKNSGETVVGSLIINRWHDNVNSLFFENDRKDSSKDTLDIVDGFYGSYPNMFLVVDEDDLPKFIDLLMNFDDSEADVKEIQSYIISRGDENFWEHFDWFQAKAFEEDPLNAALFDLNRYYKVSWSKEKEN